MRKWIVIATIATIIVGFGAVLAPLQLSRARSYRSIAQNAADDYRLSMATLLAIARVESAFTPDAVSDAGAVGLMQLMPATAQWICLRRGLVYNEKDLYDAAYSMEMAAWYLRYLYTKFSPEYALCAYNAGEGVVAQWLGQGIAVDKVPYAETRRYVADVLYYQKRYSRWFAQ